MFSDSAFYVWALEGLVFDRPNVIQAEFHARKASNQSQYESVPMQYTAIVHGCKYDSFRIMLIVFLPLILYDLS